MFSATTTAKTIRYGCSKCGRLRNLAEDIDLRPRICKMVDRWNMGRGDNYRRQATVVAQYRPSGTNFEALLTRNIVELKFNYVLLLLYHFLKLYSPELALAFIEQPLQLFRSLTTVSQSRLTWTS